MTSRAPSPGSRLVALALALAAAILALTSFEASAQERGRTERAGDVLQFALPALAAACATARRRMDAFGTGLAAQAMAVESLKKGSVGMRINRRPHGGEFGFASGHSAAAFFGAAGAARDCGRDAPLLGMLAYLAAAATAYTRVHAGKHFPWQTALGAAIGVGAARAEFRLAPEGVLLTYTWEF